MLNQRIYVYSAVPVDCWSQSNYYFGFLTLENTGKTNSGSLGF